MQNKQILIWTIVILIIGGFILFFSLNKKTAVAPVAKNPVTVVATSTEIKPVIKPLPKPAIVPTPVMITPTPTPVPIPTPEIISTEKAYTLADVSVHNNQSSCWMVMEGKVYDITKFLSSHPAGLSKIMKGCGIDATNMFNNVGAHSISMLSSGYLGLLK